MKTKFAILAALAAALLTSTAPVAMADVAVCGRTLFTPPGSNVFTGTWYRFGGQQLCAGLVVHGDDTATYVFGDGNLTHPKGGSVSDNGTTYSFIDAEGSAFAFHSDGSASFSGGSGKMVGQFNVHHMPGVAAVPKPDTGFLGSTNPRVEDNQGFSGSTAAPGQVDYVRPIAPVVIKDSSIMEDGCASGIVAGLDPHGDGFLAVKGGPGLNYPRTDKLYNGEQVYLCADAAEWYGIVYTRTNQNCNVNQGWPATLPYTGPCRSGWVHRNWIKVTAG